MATVQLNVDVNKTAVQVFNTPQFPPVPTRWTNRFDVRVWNEFETACNNALDEIITANTKKCTMIWTVSFFVFFILALGLLLGFFGSDEEYCCYSGYDSYGNYQCYEWCDESNWGMFISSMVFWGLAGCILIFILPCFMCVDYDKLAKAATKEKLQTYFNFINEKYQNMIVITIKSVTHRWCTCKCGADPNASNATYFDVEIEMKVQSITYIEESAMLTTLPTQQQVATQQGVQLMQQEVEQPQSSASYQQKHYTQWTTNDVLDWIKQLDNGSFVMYQQQLSQALNSEQIDGNDLFDLDKDDLHRFGVQNFKLKKSLLAHIQSLSLSQPAAAYQAASAPGDYNAIDIESNVNEGAITNM